MPTDAVFTALADPTRRTVLDTIAARAGITATELAADLPVTRQAVAKHLHVLAAAELVAGERAGRETHWRATPAPLNDAIAWMARVGSAWDDRLAALERSAHGPRRAP
ncbi:MAG: helix-turn-helix transcriptional regulator [Solirubrobacteraceae bacterium]|nr:helix-turn-helix transcriptional regulator [Solirubrobacteraceae bacterium]